MKKIAVYTLIVLVILGVVGCATDTSEAIESGEDVSSSTEEQTVEEVSSAPVEEEEPKSGGTLIVARTVEVHGLDPHTNPAFDNLRLYELVYNGLVYLNDELEIVPELAESWEINEAGTVYTFHLREGVKFHNGEEMTSADVKASYERILDPDVASPVRAFFTSISEIETPDLYTVVFNLSEPNAAILTLMATTNAAIVPESMIENGDFDTEMVGTGPFKLEEWVPDNYMTLVKNEDFFIEGLPYLDAIEYRVMPDESSILAGLRSQSVDWSIIQESKTAILAREEEGLEVQGGSGLNTMVLAFNASREPLTNSLVRKAVSCAIDRDQIGDIVFMGEAIPTGPLPPTIAEEYRVPFSDLECYERDVERSKSLLAEAGYEDGLSFSILTRNFSPYPEMAQVIQSQLQEVGIETTIELEEFGIFVSRWKEHDFDSYISVTSQYPDPDYAMYRTFHTDGSANVHDYSNTELDSLLELGRTTIDTDERAEIYKDVQKTIASDAPFVFLVAENQYRVMQSYVKGYKHVATGSIVYLRETWIDK